MSKFKVNDIVRILAYKGDEFNEYGRIQSYDEASGAYWVVNMNMPFYGTVSDFFTAYELEAIDNA